MEGGEHRVDHAGREGVLTDVPVDEQAAVDLGHLGVEEYLRPLGDDPDGLAEGLPYARVEELAEIERAREHHGRQDLFAVLPGQVPQDLDAGVVGVGRVGVHTVLEAPRVLGERARLDQVDVEQHRAGEVADEQVDVGVEPLRSNIGTFSRKRGCPLQAARTSEKAVATAMAGVSPCWWARAVSRRFSSGGSQ